MAVSVHYRRRTDPLSFSKNALPKRLGVVGQKWLGCMTTLPDYTLCDKLLMASQVSLVNSEGYLIIDRSQWGYVVDSKKWPLPAGSRQPALNGCQLFFLISVKNKFISVSSKWQVISHACFQLWFLLSPVLIVNACGERILAEAWRGADDGHGQSHDCCQLSLVAPGHTAVYRTVHHESSHWKRKKSILKLIYSYFFNSHLSIQMSSSIVASITEPFLTLVLFFEMEERLT